MLALKFMAENTLPPSLFEKEIPDEALSTFHIWWKHLLRHPFIYLSGFTFVVFTNICDVLVPKFIQWGIDLLSINSIPGIVSYVKPYATQQEAFKLLVLFLSIFIVLQFIGRIFWRLTLARQTHKVAARLKSLLWNRARYLPQERLNSDLSPGELMNVATGDIGTARYIFGFTLVGTIDFIFLLTFTLIAMFTIDVGLSLMSLLIVPVLPVLLHRLAKKESEQHDQAQQQLSELTNLSSLAVSTVRMQRLTQTGPFWQARLIEAAEGYRRKRLQVIDTSLAFIPITGITPLISFGILVAMGIAKIQAGTLSIGEFVAFQSFIFLVQDPLAELGFLISEWQRGYTSLKRVTKTYAEAEAPRLRSGGKTTADTTIVYSVNNLSYRYPNSHKQVLKNLSFTLKRGDRLGVFGPIGTGKSTLIHLLAGFDDRYEGSISFCGENISQLSHQHLRKKIAIVPQKPFLFAETIRNNISLQHELNDDEIWRYLDWAGVKSDVEKLPKGLDTALGEWGINLSGGQKQRLTLARALATNADVLLFDDCLSAVDTVTEEHILNKLNENLQHKTLIWVAHRASTLKHCHQLIELNAND